MMWKQEHYMITNHVICWNDALSIVGNEISCLLCVCVCVRAAADIALCSFHSHVHFWDIKNPFGAGGWGSKGREGEEKIAQETKELVAEYIQAFIVIHLVITVDFDDS